MKMETTYERIQTLAKQAYEKYIKEHHITKLDEIIYDSGKYLECDIKEKQKMIASKYFRPLLKTFSDKPDEVKAEINHCCGDGALNICITDEIEESLEVMAIAGKRRAAGDLLKVSFLVGEGKKTSVYGFTENPESGCDLIGEVRPDLNIVDLSYFFAGMYFYCELMRIFAELAKMSAKKRKNHEYYIRMMEYFDDYKTRRQCVDKNFRYPVKDRAQFCEDVEKEALRKRQMPKYQLYPADSVYWWAARPPVGPVFLQYQYAIIHDMLEKKRPFFSYADFVNYSLSRNEGWRLIDGVGPYTALEVLLDSKDEHRIGVIQNYKRFRLINSEYTKSYQTKKTQTEKLKEHIRNSRMWNYFGYVEYDESIDLDAVTGYEREFEEFYHRRLPDLDLSQNAIRFRKLGQHKAAGIYFPEVKCLCVDVHHPYSMIHELGHLIDYQNGGLSTSQEFKEVYEAARIYIERLAKQEDELGSKLRGKTKYNKDYYLYPTEVFARSFEIYVLEIWKEKLSLLPEELEPIYDCSEENLRKIQEYFDHIQIH